MSQSAISNQIPSWLQWRRRSHFTDGAKRIKSAFKLHWNSPEFLRNDNSSYSIDSTNSGRGAQVDDEPASGIKHPVPNASHERILTKYPLVFATLHPFPEKIQNLSNPSHPHLHEHDSPQNTQTVWRRIGINQSAIFRGSYLQKHAFALWVKRWLEFAQEDKNIYTVSLFPQFLGIHQTTWNHLFTFEWHNFHRKNIHLVCKNLWIVSRKYTRNWWVWGKRENRSDHPFHILVGGAQR